MLVSLPLHTIAQWRLVAGQRSPGLAWSVVGRGERGVNGRQQRSTGSGGAPHHWTLPLVNPHPDTASQSASK